ncbi:hypothetical protein ACFYXC_25110 [Streptomyces sp. NPDC002701]
MSKTRLRASGFALIVMLGAFAVATPTAAAAEPASAATAGVNRCIII